MNDDLSKETRSYRDPAAQRIAAAAKRRAEQEQQYPPCFEIYDGFYVFLEMPTEEGTRFFLSGEAIIGTRLILELDKTNVRALSEEQNEAHEERILLYSEERRLLALLTGREALSLAGHLSKGWKVTALLSATFYRAQEKAALAEVAILCWLPENSEIDMAFSTFADNIAHRLASGDRAALTLTQDQCMKVLDSGGTWYLTPATERDPLPKGTVPYKTRRTGTERITAYALKHKAGCNVLASIFWVLVLAILGFFVWRIFFS